MSDDLNVAEFFASLHRLAAEIVNLETEDGRREAAKLLGSTANLIGIDLAAYMSATLGEVVDELLIDQRIINRTVAKTARDFVEADRIRQELKSEGILLEDGPERTTWRRA